jgi:hypothetical protein
MKFQLPFKLGRLWIVRDKGQAQNVEVLLQSNLSYKHFRHGELVTSKNLGSGVVTTVGVNLLAADWTNSTSTLKLSNWHDSGTGTTAPTISDVGMQNTLGNARVQGTQSNILNVYTTIATLSYGGSYNITEWGLFSAITAGTIWDHRTFVAIPVVNGDTIQFTYALTFPAGG